MFEKIKSYVSNQDSSNLPFNHPNYKSQDHFKCPFLTKNHPKININHNHQQTNADSSDQQMSEGRQFQGGCPFMGASDEKIKNPSLGICHSGYNQPYISKYQYFLSTNKLNFDFIQYGEEGRQYKREKFNSYPSFLQHTLFYNGQDFQKVRLFQCCTRFTAYEDLREKGNRFFNKGKFEKALDYYQRAMSLFRWLQLTDKFDEDEDGELNEEKEDEMIQQQKVVENKNKDLKEIKEKYKQYLIVYHDDNVREHNGEELTDKNDIQMRNSLLLQIYLNMAAAYIKLNHFQEADNVLEDAQKLNKRVSQVYLRKAQSVFCNQGAHFDQIQYAFSCIKKAIQIKACEKIFNNTNKTVLKLVNLHDAEEVYSQLLSKIEVKLKKYHQKQQRIQSQIGQKLEQLNCRYQQILKNGYIPEQTPSQPLAQTSNHKFLQKMKQKYLKFIQYFIDDKKKKQKKQAKAQLQQILRVLTEMQFIENVELKIDNPQSGQNKELITNRIKLIKSQIYEQIYRSGKFNLEVLQLAIKQVLKQQKEKRKKMQRIILNKNKSNTKKSGSISENKLLYFAFFVPICLVLMNYLVF